MKWIFFFPWKRDVIESPAGPRLGKEGGNGEKWLRWLVEEAHPTGDVEADIHVSKATQPTMEAFLPTQR